ncbi:Hypothetical_protein [Hexamita inflata]|uniref:Hypothetical_protein n=1 Tax=Hexamita inflata TaxID=28002 RepID=A0ABP1GXM5_9EUKA
MKYNNIFSVFGVNEDLLQTISDSIINITIDFEIVQGALICIQCDAYIKQSTLIFIASGAVLSGVMLKSQNYIVIDNSSIQFRLNSQNLSGIVNELHTLKKFLLNDVRLLGYSYQDSIHNGLLTSNVLDNVNVLIFNTKICSNNISQFGQSVGAISINDSFIQSCVSVCPASLHYVYGICLQSVELGQYSSVNDSYWCQLPFIYDGSSCPCKYGYLLNISYCVDIVNTLTQLDVQLASNYSNLSLTLQNNVSALEAHINSNFVYAEQSLLSNKSFFVSTINSLNQSLTQQINNLTDNLNSVNNTLTQTTVSLQSQLDTTNYKLSQFANKQNTDTLTQSQLITQQLKYLQDANQIFILNMSKQTSNLVALNDTMIQFEVKSNSSNSQQNQQLNTQNKQIEDLSYVVNQINPQVESVNTVQNQRANNLQNLVPNKHEYNKHIIDSRLTKKLIQLMDKYMILMSSQINVLVLEFRLLVYREL